MNTKTQLLKGVLEGCVLLVISDGEIYGYELVQKLREMGFQEIVGGTIYPLLQKLEKKELLSSCMRPSGEGPDRKYYAITEEGKKYGQKFIVQWKNLSLNVNTIIAVKGMNLDDQTNK